MAPTNKPLTRTRHQRTRRRGSLYVGVLGVTVIVGMLGLTAMHLVRMTLKATTGRADRSEAAVLGSSAVENGLMVLADDPNWRTNLESDVEYPSTAITLGTGSFTWKLVDDDGDLADDLSDSVLLQGIGRVDDKTYVEQVRLQPTETGLTCLEASLHCQGSIYAGFQVDVSTNQMISSNGSIDIGGHHADLIGNAEAVGSITGDITGTTTSGITPREMPGDHVFDYYVNMGTAIDISLLQHDSHFDLQDVVLSPQSNPFGNPNPEGIYVIDCHGADIRVKRLRVLGTLVLLNPSPLSKIENSLHFEPAVPNFPSLLVSGSIQIKYSFYTPLEEAALGVNFNPVGTPYDGVEDSDTTDTYPTIIKGLVYVSGTLVLPFKAYPAFEGVVVCGSIVAPDTIDINLTYRPWFLDYPPPGFAKGNTMAISPGSWTRAPSP